uniref:Glucose transporter rco-3 n=1 Tax=Ganoderma boninense TaxID=34458 RepID=A0A5K1K861_9APHY|nr:Glucose transporter rco-3 [Ganoderma boninense]
MGIYQFKSVSLLSDQSRPVQIADELESFFHVLVYYSTPLEEHLGVHSRLLRYVHWTRQRVYLWPEVYDDGKLRRPVHAASVQAAAVPHPYAFSVPSAEVVLSAAQRRWEDVPQAGPPTSSDGPLANARNTNSDVDWGDHGDTPVTSIPMAEDVKLAVKIARHKFLLGHLAKMLDHPHWCMSDRRAVTHVA